MSTFTSTDSLTNVSNILKSQKSFFSSAKTKPISFRIGQLKKLKGVIEKYEEEIHEALFKDLHKSTSEAYLTETSFVIHEIEHYIKKLPDWAADKKVKTPLFQAIASSKIKYEPYGQVLIIAPWNYPFQLLFSPLIGAIAAGNTAICKPSEITPHTSKVCNKIIKEAFEESYIACIEGGVPETKEILEERYDYIFFTGSTQVGKIIYQAAAKHLTPVTLELGGKSPCIVEEDIQLEHTASRIVWGKFLNSGQTCIAPDYLLVNEKIKPKLVEAMKSKIKEFYGEDPSEAEDYARIVSKKHYDRLIGLLDTKKIIFGGQTSTENLYISPTLLDDITGEEAIMQEEIFGPILPIITYESLEEAIDFINKGEKPLALYIFTKDDKKIEKVLECTSSGGVCINDTIMHISNPNLPFGGVGESGIGSYHGKDSFYTFSHARSVMHKSFMIDLDLRYPPYKNNLGKLKKLLKYFS